MLALTAVSTLLTLPVVLPVLPATDIGWIYGANQDLGEDNRLARVDPDRHAVWDSLPRASVAHAVIFTADYGEAGAINELGRARGSRSR